MDSNSIVWIGSVIVLILLVLALLYLVYIIFRTSYLLPEKDQAYIRTGFGGEKIAHGKGVFIFPGLHKKLLLDMKTHRVTVERKEEHACTTKNRLRIDISADFLVRISPIDDKILLAGQTLGKAASDAKLLMDQIQGTCIEALRDATAKMSFEDLHADNQQFNERVEDAVAEDLGKWGLQLEGISIAKLTQTDLKHFDKNNALDVEGLTIIKAKIAENEKEQSLIEAERIKTVEANQLDAHKEVLRLQEEKVHAEQDQELSIAETELTTERKKEQAKASELIAIAEARVMSSEAMIKAHEMKAREVAKEEEIKTALLTTRAQQNKQVRIISADLEATRTRILAEAEKDADVLRTHAVSARYSVDAEGKKALNEAANILSDKQISMQVKEKIVKKLPEIIKESVKPIKNIDGIKIMQIDGMSHLTGGAGNNGGGGSGGQNGGGGSLSDQIVDSALRYKAQAPMVENLLKHVGLAGGGIKDLTADLQKDMDVDTPAPTPTPTPNASVRNKPKEIENNKDFEKHSYAEGKPVSDSFDDKNEYDYDESSMTEEFDFEERELALSENASANQDSQDQKESMINDDSMPTQSTDTEKAGEKPVDKSGSKE